MEHWMCYSRAIAGGGSASISSNATTVNDFRDFGVVMEDGHIVTGHIDVDEAGAVDMIFSARADGQTTTDGYHSHGGAAGSHNHGNTANVNTAPTISGDGSHWHEVIGENHSHLARYHKHRIDHTHVVVLPEHTHEIDYGIYEGPKPTALTVKVDGTVIPGLGIDAQDIDLIPYLKKDAAGKVERGAWHTVEITPNDLGRIVATINTQIFVQSRGGGSY